MSKADKLLDAATPGALVKAYLTLRRKRDACRNLEKETIGKMRVLQNAIYRKMIALGQDSFKAEGHLVYQSNLTSITMTDREEFFQFVEDNQAFDLLEARLNKEAVELYEQENDGALPPGVKKETILKLGVRKA
jgi:hypothetical protein